MKKITTLALLITLSIVKISAQTLDTLTMGAGYSVQTWYKFETDKETKSPINNWDLAFTARKLDAAIWVNPNAALYKAVAPASAWSTMTVDTLALKQIQTNTDTSLFVGAMNRTQDGVFDYGWGNYNVASHNVTGVPPDSATFLSSPPAKNATHRPSGEKNGATAFVVPGSGLDSRPLRGRTNNCV